MRIPFPERVPLWPVVLFALTIALLETVEHTDPYFVIGVFVFTVTAAVAFNVAGGFSRPSGGYVFFNALLTLVAAVAYKTWLGEPGESNLTNPRLTIMVYDVEMFGILAAAYLSRRFARREGWLQSVLTVSNTQQAVYGCLGVGLTLALLPRFGLAGGGNGTFWSAIIQINRFLPMTILLGVVYQIRKTGGRRSLSAPVVIAMLVEFVDGGLLGFSKEALFAPPFTYLLAAASQRFRFSKFQIAGILGGAFFLFYFMVPYSQYGRNNHDVNSSNLDQISYSVGMLGRLGTVRQEYQAQQTDTYANQDASGNFYHFYSVPSGIWDRFAMVVIDDALIDQTEQTGPYGYFPIIFGIEAAVPHVIWKDKPVIGMGNIYAHEIGLLDPEDTTTGISFSPAGEAWHVDRWTSMLLVAPVLWFILFIGFDSIGGDSRKSPWSLLPLVIFAHLAPEGGISGIFYAMVYGVFGMLVVAFMVAYVLPHLGSILVGPSRQAKLGAGRPSFQPSSPRSEIV